MDERPDIDIAAFRARLVAERTALQDDSAARAGDRAPVVLDQQSVSRLSRADAMQVQEMATATERRRHQRLRRLDAALARLETEEFGWCTICGGEIAAARLDSDATVPTCIDCARGAT
ncbi:MAG: TraR/DksA family transcriptional regulator [Alphaproteobacteria bacterium]